MKRYVERCPVGTKSIEFEIPDGRMPTPTHGCICGQGNIVERLAAFLSFSNAIEAMSDSISHNGAPVPYASFNAPVEHNSVIKLIG